MAVVMCLSVTTVTSSAATSFRTAVKGVSISSTNPGNVKVTWKAKKGASNYEVYMSDTKDGEYVLIRTTTKRTVTVTTSVSGESLDLTHVYYFKVRAYSKTKKKYSKFSAVKGGRPKLSAPVISMTVPTNFQAKVKVKYEVDGADGYEIWRSAYRNKSYTKQDDVDLDIMAGYVKVPKQNKYYYYKVRAFKTVEDKTYYGNYSLIKRIISKSTINGNNKKKYAIPSGTVYKSRLKSHTANELKGKKILCVGSSVVRGKCAYDTSFADYLGKLNRCAVVKEAVDGTPMAARVDYPDTSFVERLEARILNLEAQEWQPDVVLIQLSSNDADKKKVGPDKYGEALGPGQEYDIYTSMGAIEKMISDVHETWPEAKLVFFTMPKREAPRYELLRDKLLDAQAKWGDDPISGFALIDLWTNPKTAQTEGSDKYRLYMYDRLHPTMSGHMSYIRPVIEAALCELFAVDEPDPGEPEEPTEPVTPGDPEQPGPTDQENDSGDKYPDFPDDILDTE